MARRRTRKSPGGRDQSGKTREWIGGRLTPPFYVGSADGKDRMDMFVWIEQPSELVVGHQVRESGAADGELARALIRALEQPLAGAPRRPDTIRVASAAFAAEVEAAIGNEIPITIAPTPELDDFLNAMLESMPAPDRSYFEDATVSSDAVAGFFRASMALFVAQPWRAAHDGQVLRMDVPALSVDGACVSIVGALGEVLGLMIFPSLDGFDAFGRAAESLHAEMDFGTNWLALTFERGADLPATMRREVAKHGWPVAGPNAYPLVERFERDGMPGPAVERDLQIVTACAASLTAFFVQHERLFSADHFSPVCESLVDENGLEVRITAPYGTFDDAPAMVLPVSQPARRDGRKTGRNAPCPCGSGRKYKKCCLAGDNRESRKEQAGRTSQAHDRLDMRLFLELSEFAQAQFGDQWHRHRRDFVDPAAQVMLAAPWSVYQYQIDGVSVVDRFLDLYGPGIPRAERDWLHAQQAAWLSVWEVTGVVAGQSLTLCDLLSGELRDVHEESASRSLVLRDTLLGRVVDFDGTSLLCGMHNRPLPPREAAEVVRRARGRLRRKREVPVERLRDAGFGGYLIRRWEEAVAELDEARTTMPQLQNTDGHALIAATAAAPDHGTPEALSGPVAEQMILEYKERHYAEWPDHPLPALDGLTPREAVRSRAGRESVESLLKDMENHEQRSAGNAVFDFSLLRRSLGMD